MTLTLINSLKNGIPGIIKDYKSQLNELEKKCNVKKDKIPLETLYNKINFQIFTFKDNNTNTASNLLIKRIDDKIPKYGLENIGGYSCFIDSLLVPIFLAIHVPLFQSKPNCENYEKLNKTLNELKLSLLSQKEKLTCSNLLKELKNCKNFNTELLNKDEQDPDEFLGSLFDIYNEKLTLINTKIYNNNELTSDKNMYENILNIAPNDLGLLSGFQAEYVQGNRKEITEIIESDLLIFNVKRKTQTGKDNSNIKIPLIIKSNIKNMLLSIIIVHHGSADSGHYISYFYMANNWWKFDDLNPENIKLTSLYKILQDAEINGTMFFYQ